MTSSNIAVVKFSDIQKHNRMDAKFHIIRESVKDRVAELESKYEKNDLIHRMLQINVDDLDFLEPMASYADKGVNKNSVLKLINNYPYIAYALIEKNIRDIQEKAESEVEKTQRYSKMLNNFKM